LKKIRLERLRTRGRYQQVNRKKEENRIVENIESKLKRENSRGDKRRKESKTSNGMLEIKFTGEIVEKEERKKNIGQEGAA
jgi:hypothetical protein